MKTLLRIEENLIGALLILSLMIMGGCSSVQPSAKVVGPVHLVVILNNEEVHNGLIQQETSYTVNVDGKWSPLRILSNKTYNDRLCPVTTALNEKTLIAALKQSEISADQEVMLTVYDGHQTLAPVSIGTFDGDNLVKAAEVVAVEL